MPRILKRVVAVSTLFVLHIQAGEMMQRYLTGHYHDMSHKEANALYERYQFDKQYIDKLRSKVKFSHFKDQEVKYTLQAFPRSLKEVAIQEKMYALKKAYTRGKDSDNKVRKEHYKTLLEALFQKRLYENARTRLGLYHDKYAIAKKMIVKSKDVVKLAKLEHKIQLLDLASFQYEKRYDNAVNKIVRDCNSSENIEDALREIQLLDAHYVLSNAKNMLADVTYTVADKDMYKVSLLEQKVALEESKDSWSIRSFDVDYDDSKRTGNAFSVGMSIEIPIASSAKVLDNKLKLLQAKEKIANVSTTGAKTLHALLDEMTYLVAYEQKLSASMTDVDKYRKFSTMTRVGSQFMLDLQNENLDIEEEMIKVRRALYKAYIKFLDLSGRFEKPHSVNYLTTKVQG